MNSFCYKFENFCDIVGNNVNALSIVDALISQCTILVTLILS